MKTFDNYQTERAALEARLQAAEKEKRMIYSQLRDLLSADESEESNAIADKANEVYGDFRRNG